CSPRRYAVLLGILEQEIELLRRGKRQCRLDEHPVQRAIPARQACGPHAWRAPALDVAVQIQMIGLALAAPGPKRPRTGCSGLRRLQVLAHGTYAHRGRPPCKATTKHSWQTRCST